MFLIKNIYLYFFLIFQTDQHFFYIYYKKIMENLEGKKILLLFINTTIIINIKCIIFF